MLASTSDSFYRGLSPSQKTRFWATKILRRITSDLGKKDYFGTLYEFQLLCSLRGATVRDEADCYRVTLGNQTFSLRKHTSDIDVFLQVILHGEYRLVLDLIRKNHLPIATMVDAGANIGLTSALFAHAFPELEIVALEPDPDNARQLEANLAALNTPRVRAMGCGLTPQSGWLVPNDGFLDNREWSRSFRFSAEPVSGPAMRGISVEDLLRQVGFHHIDFLKMDIEGGERDLFVRGTSHYRFLEVVRMIAIEIHDSGELRDTILSILREYGFLLMDEGELTIGIKKDIL